VLYTREVLDARLFVMAMAKAVPVVASVYGYLSPMQEDGSRIPSPLSETDFLRACGVR
jgi:hypothetical protein